MYPSRQPFRGFGKIAIVAAQNSLPTPPAFVGFVDDIWNTGSSVPGELDLEITAAGAVDLTNAELIGVVQNQIEIASDDVDTVDFANDELDITTHGLSTGDGPIQFTTTGTLPTGMALNTDYYVINVSAGTIQIADSLEKALEGTAVSFSDAGSGTHSLLGSAVGDPDGDGHNFLEGSNNSYEIMWLSYGLLGPASDGGISLTATKGYSTRAHHRPRTVAYAVEATLSASVNVSVSAYPVNQAK
jgi:hypothetical protein